MRLIALLVLCTGSLLVGCDSAGPYVECPAGGDCLDPAIDPDTVDFDQVAELHFERYVRPILAARNALSPEASDTAADIRTVTYAAVLSAGPSGTLIPFDADQSLLVRLAEEGLAPGSEDPLPNLRALQDDEVRYLRRWIEDGARRSPDAAPAYADARALLYVCNQLAGRVSVVDVERQRLIRNVYFGDLGQPADARPHHVVVHPDGTSWYVALIAGSDGGSVLRLSSSLTLDPASGAYLLAEEVPPSGEATFQKPGMLAFDAVQSRLFAGRSFSADPTSSGIGRFDPQTLAFETLPTPDVHPHALGVSRDGRFVFTAALTAESGTTAAYVLDAATGDLVDQERVPGALAFVHYAVSPNGSTVVLTSQTGGALYVFDFDAASGELTPRGSVETGDQPWHPVFSPDGTRVYVPNRLSNSLAVVDPTAMSRVATYGEGLPFSQPHGSALSADGSVLFISSRNFGMPAIGALAPEASGEGGQQATSPLGAAATWEPGIRFMQSDGTPEPADLYANVALLDASSGDLLGVIQTGRWASGLALYDPR